jgi:hypothetical protein
VFQFTSRDLLAGVVAVSVGLALRNWISLPGMVAAGLFVFAIAVTLIHSQSVLPQQLVYFGYFFLLLEFAWCAPANFTIVQWSKPLPNYWNTTAPISESLGLSALVLVPFLIGAYGILAIRSRPRPESRSRLPTWSAVLATVGVVFMYLCLHAVCWFGMPHR